MTIRADARWDGRTYYGRPQVKPAPFDIPFVGAYIFFAGLSGGAQLLATLLDLAGGRRAKHVVRRGRYVSMVAPTLGAVCLIADLHMPKRFYNMLRIVRSTSPMSIGSWLLTGFGAGSGLTAGLQWLADRIPPAALWRGLASASQIPSALIGAGMCTYTASLLSCTSTPIWAAAPRALAARFAASSIASAAAWLGLGENRTRAGRDLDAIALAALSAELAATLVAEERYRAVGVSPSPRETAASDAISLGGVLVPMGLLGCSLLFWRTRAPVLSKLASLAVLAGSLAMRTQVLAEGKESASNPLAALRFAQPDVLSRV